MAYLKRNKKASRKLETRSDNFSIKNKLKLGVACTGQANPEGQYYLFV
jgi:hypothetical protein